MMACGDCRLLGIPDGTGLNARPDSISEEMRTEHSGKLRACISVARREGRARAPSGIDVTCFVVFLKMQKEENYREL